jgi:CRISPR-associated exonuclease Cas4
LAGYAVLAEEQYQTTIETAFIYLAPVGELVAIKITKELKAEVSERLSSMREMILDEILPPPTQVRARCAECEFRNYCGDIF